MSILRAVWRFLAEISGQDDYRRYCAHVRARHPERSVPTEREFYVTRLEEKYARPSRCC
jgi:uncharacterized short protein YbdD (DUF466 family)